MAEGASRLVTPEASSRPDLIRLRAAQAMTATEGGGVALHCFTSDPREYFDVDLRDPAHRANFDPARLRNFRLLEAVPHCNEARYNSWGFREREPGPGRAGVRRAVVLGSDVVEGFGLREADTLSRRLEAELGGVAWEVFSCAHPPRAEPQSPRAWSAASGSLPMWSCLRSHPSTSVVLGGSPRAPPSCSESWSRLDPAQLGGADRTWLRLCRRAFARRVSLARSTRGIASSFPSPTSAVGCGRNAASARSAISSRSAARGSCRSAGPCCGRVASRRLTRRTASSASSLGTGACVTWTCGPLCASWGETDRWIHPLDARPSAVVFRAAAASIAAVLEP